MSIKEEQIKDDLNMIEMLKQQIRELQKQKADVVRDINVPIYAAKKEAEAIIANAKKEAQEIVAEATEKKTAGDEAIAKSKQELKVLQDAAQRRSDKALEARKTLDKEKVDFNAAKYAFEANLKQQKMDADRAMSEAVKLQGQLNILRVNLDSRQSIIQKREEDYLANLAKLEQAKNEVKGKIDILATREKSLADEKIEIVAIKVQNDQVLADTVAERNKISKDAAWNQKNLDEIKSIQLDIIKKNEENSKKLKLLDISKAEQSEKEKSLNEKERLQKILIRQVEEKITTLNRLRAEEK